MMSGCGDEAAVVHGAADGGAGDGAGGGGGAATAVLWADVGLLRQGGQHASARPSAECLARSTPARNFSDPNGRPPVHSGAEHRSRQGHWISPFLKSLRISILSRVSISE